jgi:hypothetical protein
MWIDNKEAENDPYNRGQNNTNANVGAGGGGSAPLGSNTETGNPSTTSPAQPAAKPQKFATVQDYLGNNQTQAEDLGQKVTSSLEQDQQNKIGDINKAADATKGQITDNTINFNSGLVDKASKDPSSVANSQPDLNSFLKQWNASYAGPSSFEGSDSYSQAAKAASDAQQKSEQLKTTGGREQLIGDQFNVYGQGNKGLDQALLQSSSYFPKVQDEGKQYGTIQDYLGNKAADVNQAAATAKQTTDATKAATQAPFENRLTGFTNDLDSRVAAARTSAGNDADKLKTDLASGNIGQDLTNEYGNTPEVQRIQTYLAALKQNYGTPDLSGQLAFNPNTDINRANVATPQDYAKAKALEALTGVSYNGVLPEAAPSAAPAAIGGVNPQNLSTYLQGQMQDKDKSLVNAQDINSVFTQLGTPSITDPKNAANADFGGSAADALIRAAGRQGMALGDTQNGVHTPSNLENLFNQAVNQFQGFTNPGAGGQGMNDPRTLGLREFVNRLGQYLYGRAPYGDVTSGTSEQNSAPTSAPKKNR